MDTRANNSDKEDQALLEQPKITDDEAAGRKKKKIIIGVVVALVIVGVALAIALPLALSKGGGDEPSQPTDPNVQEFNPYEPGETLKENQFEQAGVLKLKQSMIQRLSLAQNNLATGKLQDPELLKDVYYKPLNPKVIANNINNKWANNIKYNVSLIDTQTAKLEMHDNDITTNYGVSDSIFKRPSATIEARFSQLGFSKNNTPFGISFSDRYTGKRIISTSYRKLFVSEKVSEIGFTLPNDRIFGLGQHNAQFQLRNGTYSLYAKGFKGVMPEDNALGGISGNHIHPFLLYKTQSDDFAGLFFASTAGMAFEIIRFDKFDERVVNYITLGGHIEVYFFFGGTANEIIAKYQSIIGKSQMPPYYALGVEQATWKDADGVAALIGKEKDSPLAIEGYHLYNYCDEADLFTVKDAAKFKQIGDGLREKNQKLSLATTAYYKNDPEAAAKKNADALAVNLQSDATSKALIGQVNDVTVNYPDFFAEKISTFYTDGISSIYAAVGEIGSSDVQGLEFRNDVDGEVQPSGEKSHKARQLFTLSEESIGLNATYEVDNSQEKSSYKFLPFTPGFNNSGLIDHNTVSPSAKRSGFDENEALREFYVHNGNAHLGLKKMNAVASGLNKQRPALLTSTSWAGTGSYAIGLITNLERSWDSMKTTISMAMGLSMYGFSNIMTDVCGTKGDLDEKLCGRWMQLAAFLPMARNYYAKTYYDFEKDEEVTNPPSEFASIEDFDTINMVSSSLQLKLSMSLYVYSEMYKVHKKGGAIVRPLYFDYPNDNELLKYMDNTFMLGESILVAPLLTDDAQYDVVFPKGKWVHLKDQSKIIITEGESITLKPAQTYANAFIKQGRIIPFQKNSKQVKTTTDFRTQLKTTLLINPDDQKAAVGHVLIDDGISSTSYSEGKYVNWEIRHAPNTINFWPESGDQDYQAPGGTQDILEEIRILNADDELLKTNFACYFNSYMQPYPLVFSLEAANKVVSLRPADGEELRFNDIQMIKYGNSDVTPNLCDGGLGYKVLSSQQENPQSLVLELGSYYETKGVANLKVKVDLLNDDGLIHVEIYDEKLTSYIPEDVYTPRKRTAAKELNQFFDYSKDPLPFSYTIFQEGDPDTVIYQSDPSLLYVSEHFVIDRAIFTLNPDNNYPFMGLGERAGAFFYGQETNGKHTSYSYDQPNPFDDGKAPGKNLYGSQPFYAYQASNKEFLGVFNLNSYAQEFILNKNNPAYQSLANIMIGGRISKFFIRAQTIEELTVAYQDVIGRPALTPLWTFGWHQCRYGYVNAEQWEMVVVNYTEAGLPLDAMWADIDYLDSYKIFTVSPEYAKLKGYVDAAKVQNIHFVPILDPGVAIVSDPSTYQALKTGKEQDVFIKGPNGVDPLVGKAWPGKVYYPDFTHPNTTNWWHQMLDYMRNDLGLEFDGIWLDVNEVTNDCDGYCDENQRPTKDSKNLPSYVPGSRALDKKSLGMDALHYNKFTEYAMHNMYGFQQVKATAQYFIRDNKMPYVLSRSNFPGMQRYGHHWLGDNWTRQDYLTMSVQQMYAYSLHGIPFVGSDICGFDTFATTLEEIAPLCTRWHQLGALYPFARNHNQNGTIPHEPYRFHKINLPGSTTTTYSDLIADAIKFRYNLVRYYYTQFESISRNGGSFFKPLAFLWSNDPLSYQDTSNNIMLGNALKLSIQVTDIKQEGGTNYYFPESRWCQLYPKPLASECFDAPAAGVTRPYKSGISDYQLHMRGGYIIPVQDAYNNNIKNVNKLSTVGMQLGVLLNKEQASIKIETCEETANAAGQVYYDDGVSFVTQVSKVAVHFVLNQDKGADIYFCIAIPGYRKDNEEEKLESIRVLGAQFSGIDTKPTVYAYTRDAPEDRKKLDDATYDSDSDVLTINCSMNKEKTSIFDIKHIQLVVGQ